MKEVEIYAAQICTTYNFSIDENIPLSLLAEEIFSVIAQKEQSEINGNAGGVLIYNKSSRYIYDMTKTPAELGIKSGDLLCLV